MNLMDFLYFHLYNLLILNHTNFQLPEQTSMVQDHTDLFSSQSKPLSSSESKVPSLELGQLTAYVSFNNHI